MSRTTPTRDAVGGCLLSTAEQALWPQLLGPDVHCLLLSGSYARGWEHLHSDVDVIVIGTPPPHADDEEPGGEAGSVVHRVRYLDGKRWDIEYYTIQFVEHLCEAIQGAAALARQGADPSVRLSPFELGSALRLHGAVGLSGRRRAEAYQKRLQAVGIGHVVTRIAVDNCDAALDDTLGLLEAGDTHTAVLAASAAVGHAVDALLASYDELWPGSKWRYRKYLSLLERRPEANLALDAEACWRLLTLADLHARQAEDWVRHAVTICQNVLFEVMETAL